MMSWRSNPLIFSGFFSQAKPLEWEEHLSWFNERNKDWRTFVIVLCGDNNFRDIGVVTLGQLDHWSPEIGFYIGEVSLWGKKYGKEAVKQSLAWLKEQGFRV